MSDNENKFQNESDITTHVTLPENPRWSLERYAVAQAVGIEGKTPEEISKSTGIPVRTIKYWLKEPEYLKYVNQMTLEAAEALKAENIRTLVAIKNAKLNQAIDKDDLAGASKKDLVDIIMNLDELLKKETAGQQSTFMSQMEEFLEKSKKYNSGVIDVTPKKNEE